YDPRVMSRLGVAAFILVTVSGCGGGGGGDKPAGTTSPGPPASRQAKAVESWANAAQAYWDDFRSCGSRVTQTRDFFSSCTTRARERRVEPGPGRPLSRRRRADLRVAFARPPRRPLRSGGDRGGGRGLGADRARHAVLDLGAREPRTQLEWKGGSQTRAGVDF